MEYLHCSISAWQGLDWGFPGWTGKIPAGCTGIAQLFDICVWNRIQMKDKGCCFKGPKHLPIGKTDRIWGKLFVHLRNQLKWIIVVGKDESFQIQMALLLYHACEFFVCF